MVNMKNSVKFLAIYLLFVSAAILTQAFNVKTVQAKQLNGILPDSIAPDHSGMSNSSSVEFAKAMAPGWNIGNSLDAIGGETAWGNPLISQKLIDSVKAAGFNAIRIPVAWSRFTDTLFTIDTTWLNRVEDVVNYILKDSMYAIINEHWDGGWQQPTHADSANVNHRLSVMWRQIAIHFRNYNDHLLFAGTNEVMVTNNYNTPTKEYYTVQNSFNQTFVNAVRSTGGRNFYRYLLVQGFNTNIDNTVNFFSKPLDVTPNRLMVEVHYYDPYDFTINTGSSIIQWGKNATDPSKTETWANESYADGQFQKMKVNFIDKDYAVILGEYGAMARLNLGATLNAQYAGYRRYYMQYITGSMFKHGLIPFYWDNGGTGNFGMGIFNRSTGSKAYPDIITAIINAVDTTNVSAVNDNISLKPSYYSLSQNYPNPFNPETTIEYQVPKLSHVTIKIYDVLGNQIAMLVNEDKEAGKYSVNFEPVKLSSGIYFYTMEAVPAGKKDAYTETKKLILIK
jgi:endoglucanase